ncbi:MAG: efflux RND transporter periplasmic adaptor subunit, partial [Filifactor alocis]|uniref:efflux RND transporter periplasmic adaptor subunit n=1 Tax=Filifactor alocis TaxID=143361 RepID=UPI003F9F0390
MEQSKELMATTDVPATEEIKFKQKKSWKKRVKKKYIFLALLVLAGGYGAKNFLSPKQQVDIPVKMGNVTTRDIEETLLVEGPVSGSETAEVTSALNNKILQINVKEGDYVTKGQVLAVLDSTDIQNEISQAQQKLELSKLTTDETVRQQQTNYDNAVITMNEAKRVLDQSQSLLEAGAISEDEFILAKQAYEKAVVAVDGFHTVNGKVVPTESQKKSISLDSNAIALKQNDIEKTLIKSPINGTVTRVNARLGRYAADTENKAAMFVIEDLVNLNVKVRVGEQQIGKIKLGQQVTISSNILGKQTLAGVVDSIAPSGENKDASGTKKVIPVTIKITEKSDVLIPGVTAKSKIMIASKKGIKAVPSEAVHADLEGNNHYVYRVLEDNTVKKVPVQ